MSSGRRFKFNGSTVQVSIGSGSPKTITDISEADPALVTSVAHGQALGTVGRIAAVVGMTEVNGKLFVVDVIPDRKLARPVTLAEIKADAAFAAFPLVRMSRLSVMPVTDAEWARIEKMSGTKMAAK